ncbi:transketolase [Candidatus Hakubella thermalkaliphila]|nr:transketolase [Candidatus Hakubella thermalkaliphila]
MNSDSENLTAPDVQTLESRARQIRRLVVQMNAAARSSHVGSALSIVDLLVVLYFRILRFDLENPRAGDRDRFILSKGHGCTALYATLAERGFFSKDILDTYYQDGGLLAGHADNHNVPGIEVATGSLGHGLSIGVGMALAGKHDQKNYRVFVLLGDGECDEGSVWEATMSASHFKLDNLITIVDFNKLQAMGRVEEVMNLEPFAEKWCSFGWSVREIDGHDFRQIEDALTKVPFESAKPSLILAHTVKGKGVSYMEDQLSWHYKSPNERELALALEELEL